ncbi:LysE family translocator [Achromobacter pestifer]|uniref:LysE family translocator n=1 Tax=Achromobacter pestifer TaxID=1353889 RepID=A0A7D4HXE6_9BURK|nr:LysE family translocator [Achromobacter pestifer]QKH35380.1 LysE family translocator [Achromobacter pestifer]
MFGIQNYSSFIVAILIFQAVPGAGTIAILDATARYGRKTGLASVAGTLVGDFIFMIAAAAGLAAVLQANPLLFRGLQWFGAAYLCWMGIKLFGKKFQNGGTTSKGPSSRWKYFRRALGVSLTNPKVVLFFVAFFPLFMNPGAHISTLAIMMLHVSFLSLVYQALLVFVGNDISVRLKSFPSARRLATWTAGLALVGLSLKLLANSR